MEAADPQLVIGRLLDNLQAVIYSPLGFICSCDLLATLFYLPLSPACE
jgi:hypothetical protein